jgi:hypothetical protein
MKQGHLPEPCGSRNEACSRSGAHSGGLSDGRSRSRRTPEAFARASRAPPRSQRPGTVAATGSSNARSSVRRDGGQTHAPHLSRASKLVGECMRMSPMRAAAPSSGSAAQKALEHLCRLRIGRFQFASRHRDHRPTSTAMSMLASMRRRWPPASSSSIPRRHARMGVGTGRARPSPWALSAG